MRKNFFLLAAVVFSFGAMLLATQSCSSPTSSVIPTGRSGVSAQGLQLAVTATKGDGNITFNITMENSGSSVQTLHFRDAQIFDIEVKDHGGDLVWRWSNGLYFAQVLCALEIAPGGSSNQQTVWGLTGNDGRKLPSGSYTAKIYITCSPRDEALVVEIALMI